MLGKILFRAHNKTKSQTELNLISLRNFHSVRIIIMTIIIMTIIIIVFVVTAITIMIIAKL